MNSFTRLASWIIVVVLLSVPFVVYFKAQALMDWWKLRGYNPPTAVATLVSQDTMNAYTKHMFYINHPQIVSGVTSFRQDCPDATRTIVLGCYHPDQNGIYIYAVNDALLYGVQQVTAAHEVLHAVYARLSSQDRQNLNSELEDYYKNDLTDQRVLAEVKLYQQTEPDDVMDEMSCTFGTEIAALPPALEAYYQHYFTNRQAIVNFEQSYQNEFTSRENIVNADDAQLSQLKTSINAQEDSLGAQSSQINSDRARLNAERSNPDLYNSEASSFNNEIDVYNAGVNKLRADISSYNDLVNQRNAVAQEIASLDQSIDTRLTTQPAQ
jgi:hypothetical protein